MVRRKILIVFAVLALAGAIGCRDAYYDKKPVYSAHEYLTREDRADELVYAIQQAGLTGVALIAGSHEAPVEAPFPDPGPPPDPNELVLKAFDESKGILIPFVTIAPDDSAPLDTFKALHQRGARDARLRHVIAFAAPGDFSFLDAANARKRGSIPRWPSTPSRPSGLRSSRAVEMTWPF